MNFPLVPLPVSTVVQPGPAFALHDAVAIIGETDAAGVLSDLVSARTGGAVSASVTTALDAGGPPAIELRIAAGGPPESYRIAVDAASAIVTGADRSGLFYGVQTLGQLITSEDDGFSIPAVRIEDAPRFSYRGVMLDVARHFFPVEVVTAYIDRAAGLKFNALHLHLSDDQGWRLHLDSRPRLTELASATAVGGDAGGFYSKADYRRIVAHAASRHMIVVPEIDLPGHTHAVGLAYPELAEAPVLSAHLHEVAAAHGGGLPTAGATYTGMGVGFSSLKIHDEATYDFVADVVGELAAMTPGPFVHIGGDEALGTSAEDFALFMRRATAIVADIGKTPVTWHEAGAAPGIHPDTVGQYWGLADYPDDMPTEGAHEKSLAFARDGGGLILSPADAAYLDMKYEPGTPLGLTWANGPTSVQRAYAWEPGTVIDGVGEAEILGVEAPLWTETIRTLDDIDAMAFPRIAAVAEAAWSPPLSAEPDRTWSSFRARVGGLAPLWSSLGIRFHASPEIPWAPQ